MNIQGTELVRAFEHDLAEGLSRRDIARKARISEGTVRNALDGKPLTHEILARLARFYFKVPIDEMYRIAGMLPREATRSSELLRSAKRQLEDLNPDDLEEIVELIKLKIQRRKKEQKGGQT